MIKSICDFDRSCNTFRRRNIASSNDYCEVVSIEECESEWHKQNGLKLVEFLVQFRGEKLSHKCIIWPSDFEREQIDVGGKYKLLSVGYDQPDDRDGSYRSWFVEFEFAGQNRYFFDR